MRQDAFMERGGCEFDTLIHSRHLNGYLKNRSVSYFTAFLRAAPALNTGTFLAAIFISLPV